MSNAYFSLAAGNLTQNWSNAGLITSNDDWSGVPSIVGYLGDVDSATGADPQTLTGAGLGAVDVNANQTNPNSFTTGGVAEFAITDPTIALAGSGTADAPSLVLYLDATGRENVTVAFNARDIDGSADNATQQLAVQYRVGGSGSWTNVPGGYVADVTTGGSATQVTPVSLVLPAAVNGQAQVEVRILTTNAAGNDEWVGIDDIVVSSAPAGGGRGGHDHLARGGRGGQGRGRELYLHADAERAGDGRHRCIPGSHRRHGGSCDGSGLGHRAGRPEQRLLHRHDCRGCGGGGR